MSFLNNIKSVSENLPTLLEKLNAVETNNNSTVQQIKQAQASIEASATQMQTQYNQISSSLPTDATTQKNGLVKLSSIETLETDTNAVITASMLKHIFDNIIDYIPEATTETIGLVKLATEDDIEDEIDNPITINNIKQLNIPLDATTFRTKGNTKQGLQYIIDKLNENEATLSLFGMLRTKPKTTTKIYFPYPVSTVSVGAVIKPVGTYITLNILNITKDYIEYECVSQLTESTIPLEVNTTININACLLSNSVIGLTSAEITEEGKINISWSNK